MFIDPARLRRAQDSDIRKVLLSEPARAWTISGEAEGVDFEIESTFEIQHAVQAFPAYFREVGERAARTFGRHARIRSAGGYTRTDEIGQDAARPYALEHPELGAVYVDPADTSYLHFSPNQLPATAFGESLLKAKLEWDLADHDGGVVLSLRGVISIDVVVRFAASRPAEPALGAAVLAACLPGIDVLAEAGLPFEKLVARGAPREVETWAVDRTGRRIVRLARHRLGKPKSGRIDPKIFEIPDGFRDLRVVEEVRTAAAGQPSSANGSRRDERAPEDDRRWHPLGRKRKLKRRTAVRRGQAGATRGSVAMQAASRYQYTPGFPGGLVPREPVVEPAIPSCLPSTFNVSSAFEIRQSLLDAIRFVVNLITSRLTTAEGGRIDPDDEENTRVELTVNWLADIENFAERRFNGLFCLLRDPPPEDDALAGGDGLLDRMAATMAAELVSQEEPLPLGGEDDPIVIPAAIEDEIAALVEDTSVRRADRFGRLSASSRATIREAVLAQRLAVFHYDFNGDFGENPWPSESFELLRVKLQLQELLLEFVEGDSLGGLTIALDDGDANDPQIDLKFALGRLDARVTLERWPGFWFWITAAGVLVAASIVGSLAVTAIIVTLIGLGPLGLLLLMFMLSQAPVALVAGGALLVAAVTFLVWNATDVRVLLEDVVIRSRLSPGRASDPDEVLLEPDNTSMDGNITVFAALPVPADMQPVFDDIVNWAIDAFDAEVRGELERRLENGLEAALRRLPHFRLPQPFETGFAIELPGGIVDRISIDIPGHELLSHTDNGVVPRLLSAGALTRMKFPSATMRPLMTQVDADLREQLTQRMEALIAAGVSPRFGYAISQNLLNGIVFSQWLSGRYVVDYDEEQVAGAFQAIIAAFPDAAAAVDDRAVHVWAATSPYVLVTPRAYDEDERRPYLMVRFPDVRMCVSGIAGKAASLEIQLSIEAIAHVAFGGAGGGGRRTLFSLDGNFLNVLFDDRVDAHAVSPVGTQGLEPVGAGFGAIGGMSPEEKTALLTALEGMLDVAAGRLLRRANISALRFLPDTVRVNEQLYDGLLRADIMPRRSSVYVAFLVHGAAGLAFPDRDANDNPVGPAIDLETATCADGTFIRTAGE